MAAVKATIDALTTVNALTVMVGGVLGMSGLIIAKRPDAKQFIDKLTPYQAIIGVAMLGISVVTLLRSLKYLTDSFKADTMLALGLWCMIGTGIALGALFGMPQIAKMIPGDSPAEQKALELTQKIAPFQVILGAVAVGAGLIVLLFKFGIMKVNVL